METSVRIPMGSIFLEGDLQSSESAAGVILFAHGSGSSRHSPRNRFVAGSLQGAGFATLLLDLLTSEEESQDEQSGHLRFDVRLLAERLLAAADWLSHQPGTGDLPIGYFGASTGAAAALIAAAQRPDNIFAVVSRGGRPDLAGTSLTGVRAPTLLIVGAEDHAVVSLNRAALAQLAAARTTELVLIPKATHLFSEPGTLEEAARLACQWFRQHVALLTAG